MHQARHQTSKKPPAKRSAARDVVDDNNAAASRLISKAEVCDRVCLTFASIWKLMRQSSFPRSRVVGGKTVWIEAEVESWIAGLPTRRYKGDPVRRDTRSVA